MSLAISTEDSICLSYASLSFVFPCAILRAAGSIDGIRRFLIILSPCAIVRAGQSAGRQTDPSPYPRYLAIYPNERPTGETTWQGTRSREGQDELKRNAREGPRPGHGNPRARSSLDDDRDGNHFDCEKRGRRAWLLPSTSGRLHLESVVVRCGAKSRNYLSRRVDDQF